MKFKEYLRSLRSIRQMFRGLGLKMLMMCLMPVLLLGAVIGLTYLQVLKLNSKLSDLLANTVPSVSTSMEINSGLNAVESQIWAVLATQKDEQATRDHLDLMFTSVDKVVSAIDVYKTYAMPEKADKLRVGVVKDWEEVFPKFEQISQLIKDKKYAEAEVFFKEKIQALILSLKDRLSTIELNNLDIIETYKADATKETRRVIFGGGTFAVVFSLLVCLGIGLSSLKKFLDISHRLNDQSSKASEQAQILSRSADELATASGKATGAIDQTASAIVQIRESMHHSDNNAKLSARETLQNMNFVRENEECLRKMNESVEGIEQANAEMEKAIEQNNQDMEQMFTVMEQIIKQTSLINDIVFQTKLLSFNASVEAARAGEHGKGFSVVAQEIGLLASSSGKAATEITQMLEERKKQVREITIRTKENLGRVSKEILMKIQDSKEHAAMSVQQLQLLSGKSSEVEKLIEGISNAISEQTSGISEVNKAFTELSALSAKSKEQSTNLAGYADAGAESATDLSSVIQDLNQIIKGAA